MSWAALPWGPRQRFGWIRGWADAGRSSEQASLQAARAGQPNAPAAAVGCLEREACQQEGLEGEGGVAHGLQQPGLQRGLLARGDNGQQEAGKEAHRAQHATVGLQQMGDGGQGATVSRRRCEELLDWNGKRKAACMPPPTQLLLLEPDQ